MVLWCGLVEGVVMFVMMPEWKPKRENGGKLFRRQRRLCRRWSRPNTQRI